ncbi:MAG TPA: transposase [Vicinamibacterales bacterium]|nr:transposase [Vicinamibacterales bacterium]
MLHATTTSSGNCGHSASCDEPCVQALFTTGDEFQVFVNVLAEAKQRCPIRMPAFTVMKNHWHLILWPEEDFQLSSFMHWLTGTHTQRWHAAHHTEGTGPLYQGRFKAFPIQGDDHFLTVVRYVERNPVRAGLVERAQDWQWSSAWHRCNNCNVKLVDPWPIPQPADWLASVNEIQNQIHLSRVRESVARSRPFVDESWSRETATKLHLEYTFRPQGRPSKK